MRRFGALAGALLALAVALPAEAATVTREAAPLPPLIEDPSCGYILDVTFPVNDEYLVSVYDNDGNLVRASITGNLVVTFTNPDTDESITANISGPFLVDGRTGELVQAGRAGGPLVGYPFLALFAGRMTDTSTHGHLFADVCAALA